MAAPKIELPTPKLDRSAASGDHSVDETHQVCMYDKLPIYRIRMDNGNSKLNLGIPLCIKSPLFVGAKSST